MKIKSQTLMVQSAMVLLVSAMAVGAANNNWTNSAGGSWEGATNWSLGTVPGAADTVQVGASGTYTVTLGSSAINAFPSTLTNNGINVYSFGSGTPTLDINFTNAATLMVNNSINIGNAIMNVNTPNGGVHMPGYPYALYMGSAAYGLTGTLNVMSGTFDAGWLFPGLDVGSVSTINVNTGGVFSFNTGEVRLGVGGTAILNINGGTLNWNNQAFVGYAAGATGRVVLSSGSLVLGLNAEMDIGSGYKGGQNGYGQVIISNGFFANNSGFLIVGSGPASRGDFELLGGTVTNNNHGSPVPIGYGYSAYTVCCGYPYGSATGNVLIAGGSFVGYEGWNLGALPNSLGTVVISNGNVSIGPDIYGSGKPINVGYSDNARGDFTMAGGTFLMNGVGSAADDWVAIGVGSNSVGNLRMTGGLLNINNNGPGLIVGSNAYSTASAVLEGGVVQLRTLNVGSSGVLSNRPGGVLQFVGSDTVLGSGAKIVDGGTLSYKGYANLGVNTAAAKFNIVSGSDLQLDTSTNANIAGTYVLTNAPGSFKELSLAGNGSRWQSDSLYISPGASLTASGATARVASVVTNDGTISQIGGHLTFEKGLFANGIVSIDPPISSAIFTLNADGTLGTSGAFQGDAGALIEAQKSLIIHSTNNSLFDLSSSTVQFDGGGNHTNAVTGGDFGTNLTTYPNANFSYGALTLASATDQLYFVSGGFTNGLAGSNALYVTQLNLFDNSGVLRSNLVTDLHSPFHIYYLSEVLNPGNAYLNDASFPLSGGGELLPFVPEPSALLLAASAAALLVGRRFRGGRRHEQIR